MRKGRKSKGKDNQIILQTEKKKKMSSEQKIVTLDEQTEQIFLMKIGNTSTHSNNFQMMTDSENFSIDERSEVKNYSRKHLERIFESGGDNFSSGQISGPLTRRKENQIMQLAGKIQSEKSVSELNTLLKFDEFYKERKNVENDVYFYHPPRISRELFQASIRNIDTDICTATKNESVTKENSTDHDITSVFEYEKISKDDLNYYLKFAAYYKETFSPSIPGNIILKGAHSFELNALNLLKESNYNVNLALRKILFPVLDLIEYAGDLEMKDEKIISNLGENIITNSLPLFSAKKTQSAPAKDPMIYVNSALNDLIGSNIQEKQEWLRYIKERINATIEFDELQILLELGGKMKIDIPDFVTVEIEKSFSFAKIVRRHLTEKNSLKEIINLLEQSKHFKVRTDEFVQLEDILKKSNAWLNKVKEVDDKTINYKTLQSFYHDAKSLPVKFDQYDSIKLRYLKAQKWQEKYQMLPKHSKTRQQGVNTTKKKTNSKQQVNLNEKCTVSALKDLVEDSKEINFTSNDVVSLETNLKNLIEAETKIATMLDDPNTPKTKELLTEFVNILDNLKFATDLYDLVLAKLEYLEWQEKKDYYMGNKVLKMKHLRNLIRDANQKNLNILPEIQSYRQVFEKIEAWMEKMADILYNDDKDNLIADLNLNNKFKGDLLFNSNSDNNSQIIQNNNSLNNNFENDNLSSCNNEPISHPKRIYKSNVEKQKTKPKIDVKELCELFTEGRNFEIKPEEIEHLLNKCEEFFEFYEECKQIKNQSNKIPENTSLNSNLSRDNYQCNYGKLISLRKQISCYNIKCEEFDLIDNQINFIQKWIEDHQDFIAKLASIKKDFPFVFKDFDTLEQRQDLLQMLEIFCQSSKTFYEDLIEIMEKVPQFAKNSKEYLELLEIKENAEKIMNEASVENVEYQYANPKFPRNMRLEEIQNFICQIYIHPVKKTYFSNIVCEYKSKSWSYIASLKKKKSLYEAESMVKESVNLNLNSKEVDHIKCQIIQTKDWIKQSKEPFGNKTVSYEYFLKIVNDGASLPLITNEYHDLINFKENLDNDIADTREFLKNIHNYQELAEFYEKINYTNVEVPEFEIIIKLKNLCEVWKKIAQKILNSRKLCQLFFKKSLNDENENTLSNYRLNKNNIYNDKLLAEEFNSNSNFFYKVFSASAHSDSATAKKKSLEKDSEIEENSEDKIGIDRMEVEFDQICSNEEGIEITPKKIKKINKSLENFNISPTENHPNIKIINNNYFFQNSTTINGNNIEVSRTNHNCHNHQTLIAKKKQKKQSRKENSNAKNFMNHHNFQNNNLNYKMNININEQKLKNKTRLNRYKVGTNKPAVSGNEKQDGKITIEEYYNIGPISNQSGQNLTNNLNPNSKFRLKKFNSLSYEEKIKFISQSVILRDDNIDEKYCICRRGDDSVNYMIMCENCQEWFHGTCLGIGKSTADKIPQYLCLLCSKRKDSVNNFYHSYFLNNKRIDYNKFLEFLKEGESLPIILEEMTLLKHFKCKIDEWFTNYDIVLGKIREHLNVRSLLVGNSSEFTKNNQNDLKRFSYFKLLDQTLEKNLINLYLESEGFPIDLQASQNIIIILKQHDWFKDSFKCLDNKKFSEKLNRRILLSAYPLFNRDTIASTRDVENIYFKIVIDRGIRILQEIAKNYHKKISIFMKFRHKFDKKSLDNLEDLIVQIDSHNNLPTENVLDQLNEYVNWIESIENILAPSNFDEKVFDTLVKKAKGFGFKSPFLDKFRRIVLCFAVEQLEFYRSVLFEEKKSEKMNQKNLKMRNLKNKKMIENLNNFDYSSEDEENEFFA